MSARRMGGGILAFDLDGTLLDGEGRLGGESRLALASAREAGWIIAFVTGRREPDMLPLGADGDCADYLVLNNGGKIVETATRRVLRNLLIEAEDAGRLASFCLGGGYLLHAVKGLSWAVSKVTPQVLAYGRRLGIEPRVYRSVEELPGPGVEGFMATEDIGPVARFIDEELPRLCRTDSEPGCIDIMRDGVDKWDGISALAGLLGLESPFIVAAGNYRNDLRMIRNATVGVAVGNALDEVKAAADYVTRRSNDEDAAVEVVERFVAGRGAALGIGGR